MADRLTDKQVRDLKFADAIMGNVTVQLCNDLLAARAMLRCLEKCRGENWEPYDEYLDAMGKEE